jgi:excinuclease ABC subunit A
VIATGTPEQVAKVAESYTGAFLAEVLPARAEAARRNGARRSPARSRATAKAG